MNLGTRLRAGAISVGVLILVAGCTSSTADGPTSTAVASATASPSVIDPSSILPSTTAPPPSPSPSVVESPAAPSLDPAAQEAVDRAAIEAQWAKFWTVVIGAVRLPDDQRESALAEVAVDPLKSKILDEVRDSEAQGLDRYGSMIQHPYWEQRIDGADKAVMGDCQDASQSGVVNVTTGKRETVGVADNNTRIAFERGTDGVWRVQDIYYLVDKPC